MASRPNFDTDLIRDTRALITHMLEVSIRLESGCLLYPCSAINVRLAGYKLTRQLSPARVAWAIANTHDHLGTHDYAVHTCQFGTNHTDGDTRVCIEPAHLIKGIHKDIAYMKHRRALGDFLLKRICTL